MQDNHRNSFVRSTRLLRNQYPQISQILLPPTTIYPAVGADHRACEDFSAAIF
jgi:hypothetical protein